MFDLVHQNKRVVQVILALIILPFAFWGIESYRSTASESLATVNGDNISQNEFDNAMRQQQERMREMMGDNYNAALFDQPDIKKTVLENLINQTLLIQQARAAGLVVNDAQLAQVIAGIDNFKRDGQFDKGLYESVLRSQGLSPPEFEQRIRDELGMRQLTDSYVNNGYASNAALDNLVRLTTQQRIISTSMINPGQFLGQVQVDDAAIQDYYDKHGTEFHLPERARVEYVAFSADSLMPGIEVSEADIKSYYESHQTEFGSPEQRHAAHILISTQPGGQDKQAARVKAEQLLQQLKQSPESFADLAKEHSQDPGSAANGGDLGTFGRGMMVKPFEDTAYELKVGEMSELVESDFGFHIIKLIDIVPSSVQPLAAVSHTIANKLKEQKAADQFAELAEQFSDIVFTQSDSLKPAAELVNGTIQQSEWINKGQPAAAPFSDKVLQAVFSEEVAVQKRNSAALEVGTNSLLAVRVTDYQPASARPLEEVSGAIKQKLQHQQAVSLAVEHGKSLLAQLQGGESPKIDWQQGQQVNYVQVTQGGNNLGRQIFRADVNKLPAYLGDENAQNGYLIVRVDAVKDVPMDESRRGAYAQELRELTGEELMQAFLNDARKRADIKLRDASTESKN